MSKNRGIFESFPSQPAKGQDSPFAVVHEPEKGQEAAQGEVSRLDSPFSVVDEAAEAKAAEKAKAMKLPDRRKADSPFEVAEPPEGFGFEAPAQSPAPSPFSAAPAPSPEASPFSVAEPAPSSPFGGQPKTPVSPSTQAALAAFTDWKEPAAAPAPVTPAPQAFAVEPAAPVEQPATPAPAPAQIPSAFAPAPEPVAATPAPVPEPVQPAPAAQAPVSPAAPAVAASDDSQSDSFSIRQLELRAIFGVDREMTPDEIMQRTRALPGMRNIARVAPEDMATIESLKTLLPNLGFGSGTLKLYSGSVPLEFIREGSVLLAVQTDGGFAPGVRETLMIVARELGRI